MSYSTGSGLGGQTALIGGNTFAHKEWIKTLPGARWDAGPKAWSIKTPSNNKACAQLAYELRQKGLTVR